MARNKVVYLSSALVLLTLLYAFQNCSPIGKSAMNNGVHATQSASGGGQNYAPNVSAGPDQAVALPNNTVNLTATASDVDGLISSIQWIQLSGPGTATLVGSATLNLTASNLVAGTYVFRVSVTDNDNLSKTDDVSVVVSVVTQPTFASISSNVLVPKCLSCHNNNSAAGGYNVATYDTATAAAFVTKGNAAVSVLYTDVNSGSMPFGGAKLPNDQILAIRDWINAGALNN